MIHLERPVAVFLLLLALLWDSSRAFRPTGTTTTLTMTTTASSSSSRKPLRSVAKTISAQRWKQTGDIVQRTTLMTERTQALAPLTDDELDDILFSIQNLQSTKDDDVNRLRQVLKETAHLSHKDWAVTEANGQLLAQVLLPEGVDGARPLLHRVLTEGNWDAAVQHAKTKSSKEPSWAVLVTGVNGIRKTTSLYQSWFPQLLEEALVAPAYGDNHALTRDQLPSGQNSFFRQLDHMIATLCNEDFLFLYQLTADCLDKDDDDDDALAKYAELKAAIFGRYRTLSELLGGALLKEAQARRANCLMETSGRDVAMFHYVNHFFPDNKAYKKLALHFTINDLSHACESVDRRMQGELEAGLQALKASSATDIVQANAGGPYGSAVLAGVQEASDKVWETQILPADSPVAADWYKATIQINAHATEPWTAQAVRPDGSLGTVFTFSPKE